MKFLSRKTHAILDYVTGIVLIAAPWIFGFSFNGPATAVACAVGIAALVYSLLTRYEAGVVAVIPFRVHLRLDVASGIFLAVSPWLFGFSHIVFLPHLLVGLWEILAGLVTRDAPAFSPTQRAGRTAH